MRVLVFGSTGQVARSLATFSDETFDIVCIGRPEGDITEKVRVVSAIERHSPDVVINAAAYTAVDAAETDEAAAFRVNCDGPGLLAEECRKAGIPIVHYSTDYVFDGEKDGPYLSTDMVAPQSAYGRSKAAGENAIRDQHPDHVILRTAWVFSPFGKNFVKTMLSLGAQREELKVVDDQVGNPSFAHDIAMHTLSVVQNILSGACKREMFGTFHLTNSGDTSWCNFAREIFRQSGETLGIRCDVKPIPTSEFPTPARRPKNSRLDGGGLKETHGISVRSWQDALADCLIALQPEFNS